MSCHSHWWWYNLITKLCLNISSTSVLHKLYHLVIWLRIRLQRMKDNCWICSGNWESRQRLTKGWMTEQTCWCFKCNKARPQQQRVSSSCHLVKHSMSLSSLGAAQARRQKQAMTYGSMKSAVFMLQVLWWTSHCGGCQEITERWSSTCASEPYCKRSALDNDNISVLLLLDLSATFNTINHQILLSRLNSVFGIQSTALQSPLRQISVHFSQ